MNSMTYSGIKILMIDGAGRVDDGGTMKVTYGIAKISIITNIYRL